MTTAITVASLERDIRQWLDEAARMSDAERKAAADLEAAKMDVCRERAIERDKAGSPYAAMEYRIRIMRYDLRRMVLEGGLADARLTYSDIEELGCEVRDEWPVTMYWRDHHVMCTSERLLTQGHVLEGLALHSGGVPPNEMWAASVHSTIDAHFPWIEGRQPFYSLLDAKAWVEHIIKGGNFYA